MLIGSLEEATIAAHLNRVRPLPKGWKKVGAGSYRTAYLAPSGTLYKVPHASEGYLVTANYREVSFSLTFHENVSTPKAQALLEKVYVPKATLYDKIVAMEYIEKGPENGIGGLWELIRWGNFGMHDIGWHNCIRMKDGRIALVDLGNCEPATLEKGLQG